ncbi:class I SAM-dependent methyltransferase [Candidatus Amarobacter glycogenicus]|uniref:class I SAM-dependent methyltransferase n=1 Tax=Candidatus Amarobacter glycogenicus TaxID=3140699 RepID=UPI003135BF02|nr:class I SAM-dependent methyltransferase [Dehalococcoidia bacterium]MCC6265963.1 class I SAM-dependent methyltransferase [Dehalococcoidia bacterium]
MVNEAERNRWNDEITVANWPKRERFTDMVLPRVLAALQPAPGEVVLDIGAGGGKLSLAIGHHVSPGGKVVGADISTGMVKLATERSTEAKAKNVRFLVSDVQVESVPGGPFDAASSQFGVMFFDEPVTAFTNIRKQLKKGGRLAFACWQSPQKNTWFPGPSLAAFASTPQAPAPGKAPTGPFALADARRTRGILEQAGFVHIKRVPKRLALWAPTDAIADRFMFVLMGIPQSKEEEATAAMNRHFDKFERRADGSCKFELNFQLFTARNP